MDSGLRVGLHTQEDVGEVVLGVHVVGLAGGDQGVQAPSSKLNSVFRMVLMTHTV